MRLAALSKIRSCPTSIALKIQRMVFMFSRRHASHLRKDFFLYTKHYFSSQYHFLKPADRDLQEVMHYLQQRIYVADDWIVSRQHPIGGMYIQGSGHTEIVDSTSKKVLWTHGSGGYFGHEKVFRVLRVDNDLDPLDSPYLARTSTESVLWFLDPVHFKRVVENFPETLNDLRFPGDMEFGVALKGSEDR